MSLAGPIALGFLPLCDAAPLIVAAALGFFEDAGLDVRLMREPSWANIRDKLAYGVLDAAQLLAPMALAMRSDVVPLAALNHGGAGLVLAPESSASMAASPRKSPLVLATVHPQSIHTFLLQAYLVEHGLKAGDDVSIVVVPPPRMIGELRAGKLDGFCAGAPWPEAAVAEGLGVLVDDSARRWPQAPDKVLVARAALASADKMACEALVEATRRGAAWAAKSENRASLVELMARPEHLGEAARTPGAFDRISFVASPGPGLAPSDEAWIVAQLAASHAFSEGGEALGAQIAGA
jgi:ABC-type nitrate/sulfonate/bicarbonate transport system substrate-binding protein